VIRGWRGSDRLIRFIRIYWNESTRWVGSWKKSNSRCRFFLNLMKVN